MPSLHPNLRTTMLQAFARTVVDESRQDQESGSAPVSGESALPPSAVVLPSVDDVVGDHYKLVRLLGQGMFGKVYVAQRMDVPEHQVALKLLPRSLYAGRNVDRELVMLATVGHPHVVQLKDHGTTNDYVWLTMPVYQGETLAERLVRGPLTLREAHDIFLPIARGIDALHSAGLRHQDIKPENIYLAVFGGLVHPIILDLGVAAEKDATFVAGTALYAAPEQVAVLSGAHPWAMQLSEKMDTYGLASTLLVALVGPELFPGESARDREQLSKAHAIRGNEPLHKNALLELTGKPREMINKALARWMAVDPAERPTMSELAEELDVLLEPEREQARAEERRRSRQRTTIQRFKMAFGGVVMIGLAGAAMMYSKREMIALASKLEEVKKEGAQTFEGCQLSLKASKLEASECAAARKDDLSEFQKSLKTVATPETSQAEIARQMQAYAARIKACEDTVTATQRTCTDEAARFADEAAKQKAALEKAHDEAKAAADQAQAQIATLTKDGERCVSERASCIDEREALRKAAASPPPPPASPPSGSPPNAGHPPPQPPPPSTAIPATTGAPTAVPAPPPPPPPQPPQVVAPPQQPPPAQPKLAPAPGPQVEDPYDPSP